MDLSPEALGLVYLATVYSKHPDGLDAAFEEASTITARLLERGYKVYSPIAHTHPIAKYGKLDPYNHDIWLPFDKAMMDVSDTLLVTTMLNWRESKGITYERKVFIEQVKPIVYLCPKTLKITEGPCNQCGVPKCDE